MSDEAITLGTTLWFVPFSRYRNGGEVTVTKVGTKWLSLSDYHRADKQTLKVDGAGYSSPGTLYRSEAHYKDEKAKDEAWGAFRRTIDRHHSRPTGFTIDSVEEALRILGIEADK